MIIKKIGITGGIGAGKSIVGKMLSTLGYPVFYSDQVAKEIINQDATVIQQIVDLFGDKAYTEKKLNKAYIGNIVFNDKAMLEKLNNIVHPAVRKAFDNIALTTTSPLIFNEAAILFETGAHKNFDATILVTANQDIRIRRVMKRDKLSEKEVISRINNQWEDKQKLKLATFQLQNNPNTLVTPQLLKIINQLISS